jgi:uncharacterized RDD family membrane protein YckC
VDVATAEKSTDKAVARAATRCYADVPDRLAALLADAVVLTVLAFIVALAVSVVLGPAVELDTSAESVGDAVQTDRGVAVVDALLVAALGAVYFIGSWRRAGRTPGQHLLGLRLAAVDDGGRPTTRQATVRWALLAAPFSLAAILGTAVPALDGVGLYAVVLAWYLVLLVTTAAGAAGRGLHDRLAGTAVGKLASAWPALREDAASAR